jgi:glucose-6-phosphate 1-epimerase
VALFASIDVTTPSDRVGLGKHPVAGAVLLLSAPGGVATIALEGGHVIDWQPRDQKPVLWLSPGRLETGRTEPGRTGSAKALRGGVPVCWPWFADHATDPTKPAHGFVRTRPWTVERTEVSTDATRVTLSTSTRPDDAALWPHAARLALTVTLADTLTLELTTRNTGSEPLTLTQALHTYFAVSDTADVSVEGFDGQSYADKIEGFARHVQSGPIAFPSEVDRIYDTHEGAAALVDRGWRRRIDITKSGSRSSVVWNPADGKGVRLGDLGVDGWRRFVCVETCNAGTDVMTVGPGQHHTLAATFAVQEL